MIIEAHATQHAYKRLRQAILTGTLPQSERLDVSALSRALGLSATPVREALFRLWGERLLEPHSIGGFRVPPPTEAELTACYSLTRDLTLCALGQATFIGSPPDYGDRARNYEQRARQVIGAIARATDNPEYEAVVASVSDRLASARCVEEAVFPRAAIEVADMEAALAMGERSKLRRSIAAYHRRRISKASRIAWELTKLRGAAVSYESLGKQQAGDPAIGPPPE